MAAGMEVFGPFQTNAEDLRRALQGLKLTWPAAGACVVGRKAGGPFPDRTGQVVATDVEGVLVKATGHWPDGRKRPIK